MTRAMPSPDRSPRRPLTPNRSRLVTRSPPPVAAAPSISSILISPARWLRSVRWRDCSPINDKAGATTQPVGGLTGTHVPCSFPMKTTIDVPDELYKKTARPWRHLLPLHASPGGWIPCDAEEGKLTNNA